MSQTTLFSCRTRYDGNFIGMTRSTRLPSASETSRSRHASAEVRISSRGYHLNGRRTSSASWPAARELADEAVGVPLGAARGERHLRVADEDAGHRAVLLHARDGVVLRREEEPRDAARGAGPSRLPRTGPRLSGTGERKSTRDVPEAARRQELRERRRRNGPHVREVHPEPAHRVDGLGVDRLEEDAAAGRELARRRARRGRRGTPAGRCSTTWNAVMPPSEPSGLRARATRRGRPRPRRAPSPSHARPSPGSRRSPIPFTPAWPRAPRGTRPGRSRGRRRVPAPRGRARRPSSAARRISSSLPRKCSSKST